MTGFGPFRFGARAARPIDSPQAAAEAVRGLASRLLELARDPATPPTTAVRAITEAGRLAGRDLLAITDGQVSRLTEGELERVVAGAPLLDVLLSRQAPLSSLAVTALAAIDAQRPARFGHQWLADQLEIPVTEAAEVVEELDRARCIAVVKHHPPREWAREPSPSTWSLTP